MVHESLMTSFDLDQAGWPSEKRRVLKESSLESSGTRKPSPFRQPHNPALSRSRNKFIILISLHNIDIGRFAAILTAFAEESAPEQLKRRTLTA